MKPFGRQRSSTHPLFELNCDSVATWVNQLALANLAETGKQLFRALDGLSELECDFRQRLEVLETLRPCVSLVIRGLQPGYLNESMAQSEKAATALRFCNAFNQRLADNYQSVTDHLLERGWLSRHKLSLELALHRELSERSQLMLRSYNLYQSEDDAFWERIHTCYRIAGELRLTKSRMVDNEYGQCTIEQAYLRPMLFVGANPYQLSEGYQLKLHESLHKLSAYVHIRESDPRKYCLMFDPKGNQPPIYQELCENAEGWLGIDTSELVEQITEQLESDDGNTLLPPQLCRKLLRVWSSISERIEQRNVDVQQLELGVGLTSTHFFVADERPLDAFTQGLGKTSLSRESDSWALDIHSKTLREYTETDDVTVEVISYANTQLKSTKEKPQRYNQFQVQAVNSSCSGYCISWPASESSQLHNGDVICLREPDAPRWSIGTIGWIKQYSEDELRAGISLLSHSAEPYVARMTDGDHIYRALLLSAERVSGKQQSLLLPNVSLPPETELELIQPGHQQRVRVGEQLQQTRYFTLYAYDTDNLDEPTEKTSRVDDEDFDQAWEIV